jgi:tRNA dimethylallyltransferase
LSADSRQFYRQMSIGTAKPTPDERAAAPHYFIDSLDVTQDYSVGDFEKDALVLLAELFETNDVVILAGGSGLYHKALCEGLDVFPEVEEKYRQQAEELFEKEGLEGLQNTLKELDYQYFTKVDIHNTQRLKRALSVCFATGKTFSDFCQKNTTPRFFNSILLCVDVPRDLLYQRINERVEVMLKEGLLAEAEKLKPFQNKNALQTVGYKELFSFWNGEYPSLDYAIDKIKQHSRNYAKRQVTWFKNQGDYKFVAPDDWEEIMAILKKRITI